MKREEKSVVYDDGLRVEAFRFAGIGTALTLAGRFCRMTVDLKNERRVTKNARLLRRAFKFYSTLFRKSFVRGF